MSTAATDASIDQLRALPLKRRLQVIGALLDSIESEHGPEPVSEEVNADERDSPRQAHVVEPSSAVPWEEVRTEIHTVCTHFRRHSPHWWAD